jgi:hypothetical protein
MKNIMELTMNQSIKQLVGTAALSLFCFSASATVIFQDDFNRANNNDVGNDWSTIERNSNDVAIKNNYLQLRDHQWGVDAAAWHNNSTESYSDIYIDFEWAASSNTESWDKLYLSWFDGSNWTEVWSTDLGGSGFTSVSVGAISGADDLSDFGFGFHTNLNVFSQHSERAKIDNVVLRGTAASVSEPGSLALLGLGLAGLGFVRKQKKSA